MNKEYKGKDRWIYKFKVLTKNRLWIYFLTILLFLILLITILVVTIFFIDKTYYVLPFIIIPFGMSLPHAVNKKRLETLYIDLPREIKPIYETFVKRYSGFTLFISYISYRSFIYDRNKIIKLVKEYQNKDEK